MTYEEAEERVINELIVKTLLEEVNSIIVKRLFLYFIHIILHRDLFTSYLLDPIDLMED